MGYILLFVIFLLVLQFAFFMLPYLLPIFLIGWLISFFTRPSIRVFSNSCHFEQDPMSRTPGTGMHSLHSFPAMKRKAREDSIDAEYTETVEKGGTEL